MNVIANINISTPSGRKIVRELEKHKKDVELIYTESKDQDGVPNEAGIPKETIPWEDVKEYM